MQHLSTISKYLVLLQEDLTSQSLLLGHTACPWIGTHCLPLETAHGSGWLSSAALGMPQDWALQIRSAGAVQCSVKAKT